MSELNAPNTTETKKASSHHSDDRQQSNLEAFLSADWDRLQLKLLKYTLFRTKHLSWRTTEGLPKGRLPEDLVMEAIRKTLMGLKSSESGPGIRRWDPERCHLYGFLCGVIDSDLSELILSKEHRSFLYDSDDEPEIMSIEDSASNPEERLIQKQELHSVQRSYRALMDYLKSELKGDTEAKIVLKAYERLSEESDEILPKKIEALTGLTQSEVKNAKRRIERLTLKFQTAMTKGKGS